MKHQYSKGFTLIEVLISAVILFSALAITAELYSVSSFSVNKATEKALVAQINPIALSSIKAEIHRLSENKQLTEFSDELNISNINYSWQASRKKFAARAMMPDETIPPEPQFGLFDVIVFAHYQDNRAVEFTFKVSTW